MFCLPGEVAATQHRSSQRTTCSSGDSCKQEGGTEGKRGELAGWIRWSVGEGEGTERDGKGVRQGTRVEHADMLPIRYESTGIRIAGGQKKRKEKLTPRPRAQAQVVPTEGTVRVGVEAGGQVGTD